MARSASRYARAIFELATEQKAVDRWSERLRTIQEIFHDPAARAVLANPSLPTETRVKAVDALDLPGLGPEGLNLMRLLVARHRVERIDEIVEGYETLADDAAGRVRATVTTAIPLSEADREALGRDLSRGLQKDVRLEARVDPAILGGLVLEVGDRLTDASVATRLDQLRRQVLVQ
ncbi:MAG: F0F1 ATP synthase subunit delta [Chloroflexi bacterium]|nr:MAG: F0F1 ATP synthase subunit delta [Chloroflexota bacterium]TMD50970.1 MAG: F0F1 ATP synthase subunit delta [Chloroflexota bacterium]